MLPDAAAVLAPPQQQGPVATAAATVSVCGRVDSNWQLKGVAEGRELWVPAPLGRALDTGAVSSEVAADAVQVQKGQKVVWVGPKVRSTGSANPGEPGLWERWWRV